MGEGHSFLSPPKGRVMRKMKGKEGGSQKNKGCFNIMFYENTNHI